MKPRSTPSFFHKLNARLRELAWSILEAHHRLFAPAVDASRLPDTLSIEKPLQPEPTRPPGL